MPLRKQLSRALTTLALAGTALSAQAEVVKTEVDGLTVRGNLERAAGASMADGVVLLVHGTKGHYGMGLIQQIQDGLTEQGYNTLAINLSLGLNDRTGLQPCDVVQRHRHEDALPQIEAWLDWLDGKGAERVALFGHSRGGNQVAWYAAEEHDPRVGAVAMAAPGTWDAERAAQGYRKRFDAELSDYLREARALGSARGADTEISVPGFLHCKASEVTAAAFLSYYADDPRKDTPTLLPKLEMPALVFAGEQDNLVPDLAERIAPLAREQSNLEAARFPDNGHFFKGRRGEIAERIGGFLKRHGVF